MALKYVWRGPEVTAQVKRQAAIGLMQAGELLLAESRKVVPLDEGTLSRSGAVTAQGFASAHPTVAVSYGTKYAVRQHEELGYRHAKGRKAKYLETPLAKNRQAMLKIIAQAIRL